MDFKRLGHLENIPMPGGDLCAYHPYRMLIAYLSTQLSDKKIRDITKNHIDHVLPHGKTELDVILQQSHRKNVLRTSSTGRFLDSIAAITGLSINRTYEGEPAMKLETLANKGNSSNITYKPLINQKKSKYILNTSKLIKYLFINDNKHKISDIAAFGQEYIVKGLTEIVKKCSDDSGINKIALSGGVFVNDYITKTMTRELEKVNLTVLLNTKVPPGDGGSALGQVVTALHHVI